MARVSVLSPVDLEVLMRRTVPFIILIASSFLALSCADNNVVQTGEITVRSNPDVDFTQFQTFSVVTSDLVEVPPEAPDFDEQEAFNDQVNQLIIAAMQAEPVCLEFIDPTTTSEENQPDLWAANGVAQATEGGYYYECCGGWYWGWWGWYWDPCAYWCPNYVEYDVGSLFVPVGLPADATEEAKAVFGGLAQSVINGGDVDAKIRYAIEEIFKQWPDPRECSATP